MRDEKEQINYYILKNAKKVQKEFYYSQKLPCWIYKTITLPKTNNTYLIYYYAMNRRECDTGSCFIGSVLLLNDNEGRRWAIALRTFREIKKNLGIIDSLQIFTGHFFSRYKERYPYMKDLPTLDLIATFFGRNGGYFAELDYDELVLKKNRQENGSAWGVDDGITLGINSNTELPNGKLLYVTQHNTFISREMLKENQASSVLSKEGMRAMCLNHFKE